MTDIHPSHLDSWKRTLSPDGNFWDVELFVFLLPDVKSSWAPYPLEGHLEDGTEGVSKSPNTRTTAFTSLILPRLPVELRS